MKSLYLTAILPPEDLVLQIDEIRKECARRFDVRAALKPPVHITLFKPLKLEEERENELLIVLDELKSAHQPFQLELKNFDTFRTNVVFVNIVKNQALGDLEHHIRNEYFQHKFAPADGEKDYHPHITIAFRDIPAMVFPELWSVYKNNQFRSIFTVNHFTLLKHNNSKWEPYRHYQLGTPEQTGI